MKNRYIKAGFYIPALLILSFIFLTSSINDKASFAAVNLDPLGIDPDLPDIPFDYSVDLPNHLQDGGWGHNDPGILVTLDDDLATLGRVLFYDEIISANQNMACATCHSQSESFADKWAFSLGVNKSTKRNSLHLNDLGWSNSLGFFWDMSHSDMSTLISLPLKDENEIGVVDMEDLAYRMNETNYYPDLFEKAYETSDISELRIARAITHFISSMTTFESKFDRASRGDAAFTPEELRGFQLFEHSCGECHNQGNGFSQFGDLEDQIFASALLFNNGLPVDENDMGIGEWLPGAEQLFKIPTLRNIEVTGPYMHDGRFNSLEEVVNHYSDEVVGFSSIIPQGGFSFTEFEKRDIVAFLKTFTDESFLTNEKWSDPFGQEVSNVESQELLNSVKLSPNPASDFAILELDNPRQEMLQIYIMDYSGKLIRKQSTHTNSVLIDVTSLSSGKYILDIRNGNEQSSKSLIVI